MTFEENFVGFGRCECCSFASGLAEIYNENIEEKLLEIMPYGRYELLCKECYTKNEKI